VRDLTVFRSPTRAIASVGIVLTFAALAACGDDTPKASEPKTEFRDYCDKSLAIESFPEPEIDFDAPPEQVSAETKTFASQLVPLAEQAQAVAPAEIGNDINVLVEATKQVSQTGDFEGVFESPAVTEAEGRVHAFDLENCGWAKVDVQAKEYEFAGIPKKIGAGPVNFEFSNEGQEPHEFLLFRVNDGVTESVEDLVALPQEEALTKISPVGATFAAPGQKEYTVVDLDAGRYGVACFVPVGGGEEGPPHTSEGMFAEFEVD
jgi:hypothetical protein